jgi:hypothetical protein
VRPIKSALLLIATAIGLSVGTAWADRGHGFGHEHGIEHRHEHGEWHRHLGIIYLGPTFVDPGYMFPPLVATPQPPPTYIERADGSPPEAAASPSRYWYYCEAAAAYYPYVKECPGGWKTVLPQPPAPR